MAKYWDKFANEYVDEKDLEVTAPPERYFEIKDVEGTIGSLQNTIHQAEDAIAVLSGDHKDFIIRLTDQYNELLRKADDIIDKPHYTAQYLQNSGTGDTVRVCGHYYPTTGGSFFRAYTFPLEWLFMPVSEILEAKKSTPIRED